MFDHRNLTGEKPRDNSIAHFFRGHMHSLRAASFLLALVTTLCSAARCDGPIVLSYGKSGAEFARTRQILSDSRIFDRTIRKLNAILSLPGRVDVVFERCSDANAFYQADVRRIAMCYELVDEYLGLSGPRAEAYALNAILFIFLHEMGHALVHVLGLPIDRSEEDAVDELAALMALAMGRDGEEIALSALGHFVQMGDSVGGAGRQRAFSDDHSLDAVRARNVACIIYGSNPERYSGLVGTPALPGGREKGCPSEFKRRARRWEELLSGHLAG